MEIMRLGLDPCGNRLFPTVHEEQMADELLGSLTPHASRLEAQASIATRGCVFRGELERVVEDPGDPLTAGWTFVVRADDPQREELQHIIKPLAEHRGMEHTDCPLVYCGDPSQFVEDYLGLGLTERKVPQYVLILGQPEQIPFQLQSILQVVAKVGRLGFTHLDHLQTYIEKLLRLENAADPHVKAKAVFFAPDHGRPDPTYFSRHYLAKPLAEHVLSNSKIAVRTLLGNDATKEQLLAEFPSRPAVLFIASHGLGATSESAEQQQRQNGAICCHHLGPLAEKSLISADDVSSSQPCFEGAIVFQMACFGYGTPACSGFEHWFGHRLKVYAETEFLAALPQKLLAHPQGPLAYIAHLDTAFLHGFTDVADPNIAERWHPRISPFVRALDRLLQGQPCGFAVDGFYERAAFCNRYITDIYDRQQRGNLTWTYQVKASFLDRWILRGDSQNYMVLGDPGARIRIPAPTQTPSV